MADLVVEEHDHFYGGNEVRVRFIGLTLTIYISIISSRTKWLDNNKIVGDSNGNTDCGFLISVQADVEHDEKEEMTIEIENVHKTYLLGVEGVPALR